MELGEIIDRSATFWRSHWRRLYGLFFGFGLVEYVLLKLSQLAQRHFAPLSRGGAEAIQVMKTNLPETLRQMAVGGATVGIAFFVIFFIAMVQSTAASRYIMPVVLGQSVEPLGAVRHALRRLPTIFGAMLLALLWSVMLLALFLVPAGAFAGIAATTPSDAARVIFVLLAVLWAVFAAVVWFFWCFLKFAPMPQVLGLEERSSLETFRRTSALTRGRIGPGIMGLVKMRLTVLFTIVGALLAMISVVTSAPVVALQIIYGNIFDPLHATPDAVPQLLLVPAELVSTAVQAIVAPLYVAFQVLFYVDMRTRREGLDLELKLQQGAA
jgi:hypothetical protein